MTNPDPRTVTLEAKDWLTIIDAIENDELLVGSPVRDRLVEAIRAQAGVA